MSNPSDVIKLIHGQSRLGLLTSSQAKTIMHGSLPAWKSLSVKLWNEQPEDFTRPLTTATEYGHAHESEGAAKFWESHPWVGKMLENQFFTTKLPSGPVLGSSPDRVLVGHHSGYLGLEIKSPTGEKNFESHSLKAHWDQCQHGLLVTGFTAWFLYVHLGDRIAEWRVEPSNAWQLEYAKRATAFWKFHNTGERP